MPLHFIRNGGKRHKTRIVGSRNLFVVTKLLALCLLLTLVLEFCVSAYRRRFVSKLDWSLSKLDWPETDLQACLRLTCWKSAQMMKIVNHFSSSDHFITTGLVHEHEGFDCEVNSPKLVCPHQDSKLCVIRISQKTSAVLVNISRVMRRQGLRGW